FRRYCSLATSSTPPLLFFFCNDTATTDIYTLSLHDALPICRDLRALGEVNLGAVEAYERLTSRLEELSKQKQDLEESIAGLQAGDRKSTRLNSSHVKISYAVFCLKKKKKKKK